MAEQIDRTFWHPSADRFQRETRMTVLEVTKHGKQVRETVPLLDTMSIPVRYVSVPASLMTEDTLQK